MIYLLNYVPLAFAILCYVLAGAYRGDPGTHDGLLLLAGALAGVVIPRLGDLILKPKADALAKDKGHMFPTLMFVFLFTAAATMVALLLSPPKAHAADDPTWTQAWTIGAPTSLRLDKSGGISVADQGCTCYSVTYQRLHLGGDACVCLRLSSAKVPNAYTTALGAHYRNAGFAFGLLKEPDAQVVPVLQLTGQVALLGGI